MKITILILIAGALVGAVTLLAAAIWGGDIQASTLRHLIGG